MARASALSPDEFFSAAVLGNPDIISVSLLEDGTYLQVNDAFHAILGYGPDEVVGKTSNELGIWAEDDGRERFRALVARDGRARDVHALLRLKSGEIRQFEITAAVVRIAGRDCITSVTRDVTERSELAERLEKSRFLLERAEEMAVIGSWEFDYRSGRVSASQGSYRIYGIEQGEFTVEAIEGVPLPEYREEMNRARDALVKEGIPYDIEFRIARRSDGAIRDIHSKARWDPESKRLFGIIRDVTEEKRAQSRIEELNRELEDRVALRTNELRRSNQQLRETLERLTEAQRELVLSEKHAAIGQLAAGIAHEVNTPLGAIVSANRAVVRHLGERFPERLAFLLGLSSGQRELFSSIVERSMTRRLRSDPGSLWERRKAIEAELKARGIEPVGRIAELLAELDLDRLFEELPALFRDPLCPALLAQAEEQVAARRMAEVVAVAADKAAVVVAALRQYLGQGAREEAADVDIERDLDTVLTLLFNRFKFGVTVERRYSGARARGSSHDLGQVWMNLINNALQAMDYKGTLKLSTESAGDRVEVSVEDSGPGIPEGIRERVFEPFFTTKKQGEGMGLGLDISRKIVENHRGRILFESRPGRTRFTVILPAAAGK
jgi:PAS domain S-box-containing protein